MESQGPVQTEMRHLLRDRPRGYRLGWEAVKSSKRWICIGREGKRSLTGRYAEGHAIRGANKVSLLYKHRKLGYVSLTVELSAFMHPVFRGRQQILEPYYVAMHRNLVTKNISTKQQKYFGCC